jgi:phage shock protein C
MTVTDRRTDLSMEKRLYRSRTDRMISGVCGGIAEYFAIDPTIVRLATVALLFVTSGIVFLIYIIMAIVVPEAPAEGEPASPRAMSGEEISAGAQGFARDIQAAAHKVVGGAAGAAGAASGAVPPENVPVVETAAAQPPDERAPTAVASTSAPDQASEHRSGTTGAILIGVLLIAFGMLMFVSRVLGVDLVAVGWKLVVPGVIIVLGVLILIRAARGR